ncbi:MAG: FAD-dependent monooxygenase [Terrimicrobiaceae bacterium]|nr:FAD-dependent monooxygenase [Terrimicrobiaceae bacterium]
MKVLIVGAGIGGLALAALLKQRGIGCAIVERAPDLRAAGYMISLYPMGSRVLHGLGSFEEFRERSAPFDDYRVLNGHGDVLHEFDMRPLSRQFGYMGTILRSDLLEILRAAAPDVSLQYGLGLEHLEQHRSHVDVRFSDGSTGTFDAVVGADGIHSKVRRIIFGDEADHETGWGLWVWWTKVPVPANVIQEFWGRGRFVGIYPTPHRTGAVLAGPKSLLAPEQVGENGLRVRELFADLGGEAKQIVADFPESTDGLFFWNLSDYRSHQWVHRRVALLGDAACAFLPTAGVGASMALESAAVLADELTRTDSGFLPYALEMYQKRRRERVEAAQDDSRKLAVWMSAESAPLVWTRDHFLKSASVDSLARSISESLKQPI